MAESFNSSTSESTSTPTFMETPENAIIDQLSSYAASLAGQMQQWANGVFAQTSQVTNQAVGNFFQVSQKMLGLSGNLTDQYNNLFAPENAQLVADANSYASPARMAVDMGQAGATQAQAGDQALKNSEEALRSYGINPADGRYAALDKAAAVQNAANVAGAENMQRDRDIQTGQRLRSEAVQVGAQLPAAIANVNNTAIQANSGASNATLANANTGRNLMSLPNDFLKTAMDVKLPPTGQNSQSKGQSNGFSSSPNNSGSGGGGSHPGGPGGPSGNPFGPSGQAWMPQHGDAQGKGGPQVQRAGPGPKFSSAPGGGYGFDNPLDGIDPNSFDGNDPNNIYQPQDGYNMGIDNSTSGFNGDIWGGDYGAGNNPFNDSGFGQELPSDQFGGGYGTYTGGQGGSDTEWGNINYDPNANAVDPGWGQTYDQPAPTDWGGGAQPFQDYGGGGGYDTSSSNSSYYAGDYSSPGDSYDMGGAYAAGGPIPATASPSGGAQTDDIAAQGPGGRPLQMNANEFVIPQDVALWKGQEFFQNLIDQSRKKRMGASAQPQQTPMR